MVTAKTYPPKTSRPVTVVIDRHISRGVKGVRCIEENRYPYVDSDVTGTWSVDCGRAVKSNLFDLRSNRIISESNLIMVLKEGAEAQKALTEAKYIGR